MAQPTTSILPHPGLTSILSKGNIAALNELSDASQVRAWTQCKIEQYKKHIKTLPAIHNSITPINNLPTKILQKIFSFIPFKAEWRDASCIIISKPGIALRALRATVAVCPVALSTHLISSGCAKAARTVEPPPRFPLSPRTGTCPLCKLLWILRRPIGKVILILISSLGRVPSRASKESLPANPPDMWRDSTQL